MSYIQHVFNDALMLILDLPPDASAEQIRNSTDLRRAAELMADLYEYFGMMVFYRIVPLRTLDLLVGGVIRGN